MKLFDGPIWVYVVMAWIGVGVSLWTIHKTDPWWMIVVYAVAIFTASVGLGVLAGRAKAYEDHLKRIKERRREDTYWRMFGP